MDYVGGDHYNGGLRAAAKPRERGLGLWPKLNAGPVCDAQHR